MKDIAIYGAGGFGREVYCLIKKINDAAQEPRWNFIGYFDDAIEKGMQLQYGKCLGGMSELNNWPTPIDICIANGSPKSLKTISERFYNHLVGFPNIISPETTFADPATNKIGIGNIFNGNNHLSVNVEVGNFNVLNSAVILGHEAKVGDCNAFMPNVRVSGAVTFGNENLIGACSFILQGLKIGNKVTLSPGSILLTKPKDDSTYMGNPAKIFKF